MAIHLIKWITLHSFSDLSGLARPTLSATRVDVVSWTQVQTVDENSLLTHTPDFNVCNS